MTATTAQKVQQTKQKPSNEAKKVSTNLNDMKKGDVFSETVHYRFMGKVGLEYEFENTATGLIVGISPDYVETFLLSAEQFDTEVEVGKEDKYWTQKQIDESGRTDVNVGDLRLPGIKTIWDSITGKDVFCVIYGVNPEKLTKKEFQARREKQMEDAVAEIEKAQKSRTGVAKMAEMVIKKIQENPIFDYDPKPPRLLRGYKIEFKSNDGRYDCVDMDKPNDDNIRPVNINTITTLVYNRVKYIVK